MGYVKDDRGGWHVTGSDYYAERIEYWLGIAREKSAESQPESAEAARQVAANLAQLWVGHRSDETRESDQPASWRTVKDHEAHADIASNLEDQVYRQRTAQLLALKAYEQERTH
jgi:hypothetical protein